MTPPIPTCEPAAFVAGDTVQWTKNLSDYPPSDGWTLKYRFVGAVAINAGNPYSATVSSGLYSITIPAADTASIVSDAPYRLIGWVEKGAPTERHSIIDVVITAFANAATATATQLLSPAEIELAALETAIANRLGSDGIVAYTIDGRTTTLESLADARQHRGMLHAKIWREQNRGRSFPVHQAEARRASR